MNAFNSIKPRRTVYVVKFIARNESVCCSHVNATSKEDAIAEVRATYQNSRNHKVIARKVWS